jgi:lipoprotein Spr
MRKRQKSLYVLVVTLVASFLLDACHSTRKVTKSSESTETETKTTYTYTAAPEYHPEKVESKKGKTKSPAVADEKKKPESGIAVTYAAKLGVSKSDITNYKLYNFIDLWYGTPYKYAGRTEAGVDCSDFAAILLQSVYDITVSGAVTTIYKQCKPIKASQLREGDLVFFRIKSKSLSHVGIYLQNHKFVHASVHAGVMIDDLGEAYYKKYFRAAGRIAK